MNNYNDKTKPQMIEEIESLKKRIEELEQSEFKHRHAEQILKANEIKLRNIIEHSSNLFYVHTTDHVITYLSPQTREFFDCEPEEAKIRWTEFLTENPNNKIGLILTEKAIETGTVQPSYELELVGKKGRKLWVEVDEAPLVEEGQTVAMVGALTDITERKYAEKALKESELRYRRLFEDSPVPLWEEDFSELKKYLDDLKEKGIKDLLKYFDDYPDEVKKCVQKIKVLDVNKATLQLFKANNKEDLLGNLQSFFTEKSELTFKNKIIAFANGATKFEIEATAKTLIGEKINVHIEFQVPKNENEELDYSHVLLSTIDITERKNAEKTLRESERNLALIYDTVGDVIFQLSVEPEDCFRFFSVNKRFLETTGLTAEQVIHKRYDEVIPESLCDTVLKNYKQAIREKRTIRWEETSNYPTGELTGIVSVSPFFDDQGECKYLIGSVHNITERKIAEDKLKQSEESYRGLFNNATDSIYIQDTEGRFLDVNEGAVKLYGYTREEFIGKTPEFLTAPGRNDLKKLDEHIKKTLDGTPQQFEFYGKKKNGDIIPKIVRLQKGKYFGKEVIIAFAIDITERKKAEARIAGLANILESSLNEIYVIDSVTLNFIQVNKGARKNLGYSNHELEQLTPVDIKPELSKESFNRLIFPLRSGEKNIINFETVHERKDGSLYPVNVHMQLIQLEDRSVFVAFVLDITKRKSAEEEIRKLSHSVEQSPAIVIITDTNGTVEYVNPKFEEVTGYIAREVIGKNPSILKSGETTPEEYEILWKTIKAGGVWTGEFHNRKKNGELYWESATISGIKNTSGEITHYVAVKEDITERKEAEEALQESEAKWRSLTENSPDHIMLLDKYANILFVNRTVPGQLMEELIGKSVYNFVPPEYHDTAKEHFKRVLNSGTNESYETKYLSEDGDPQFFSVRIAPVFHGGDIVGMVTSSTNITEHKLAEKRIKESRNRMQSLAERLQMIREEERATIAREIHDDLGQSLTALKMDISWMKNSPEMDAETREVKFNTMLDLTNSTIQTVKQIATKLRPGILDDLGLVPAIEWQAAEFQNRYKVQCNVSINKSDVIIKDEISIAVFRLFQETLTNVARHSGATKVEINLNFYDDSKLIMEIADNGVGIDEEQINSPKSLGLFGMRERVNILKGEMEIIGEYKKGTTVKVTIPY